MVVTHTAFQQIKNAQWSIVWMLSFHEPSLHFSIRRHCQCISRIFLIEEGFQSISSLDISIYQILAKEIAIVLGTLLADKATYQIGLQIVVNLIPLCFISHILDDIHDVWYHRGVVCCEYQEIDAFYAGFVGETHLSNSGRERLLINLGILHQFFHQFKLPSFAVFLDEILITVEQGTRLGILQFVLCRDIDGRLMNFYLEECIQEGLNILPLIASLQQVLSPEGDTILILLESRLPQQFIFINRLLSKQMVLQQLCGRQVNTKRIDGIEYLLLIILSVYNNINHLHIVVQSHLMELSWVHVLLEILKGFDDITGSCHFLGDRRKIHHLLEISSVHMTMTNSQTAIW